MTENKKDVLEKKNVDRDPNSGKFTSKEEKPKRVVFSSYYKGQILVMRTAEFENKNNGGDRGRRIECKNGYYSTEDPAEIEFLMHKVKNPNPGCRITVVDEGKK